MRRTGVVALLLGLVGCGQEPQSPAQVFARSRLVDLTHDLSAETIFWPTEKPFALTVEFAGESPGGYYYAANRFCTAEHVTNMQTLSDVHNHSFGTNWGTLIAEGLPLKLLTRAVFVVDAKGIIQYVEYVPEVTNHPNYDAAVAALTAAAG